MKLAIKIISRETIRPSSATPLHLKTFKLSLIDQLFPAIQIPLLLFYNAPSNTPPLQITTLKSSLSDTLSQFYPLASRCIDEDTVSCNDEGIPFIETHVNSRLTELLASSHKLDFLIQLLPPRDILCPGARVISGMVPLAFQINVFACGGVVIGCFLLHKLLDTSSFGTFFQYWAAMTAQRYHDVVEPAFDPISKAFPSCPKINQVKAVEPRKEPLAQSRPVVVLVKSFRFTKTAINDLKVKAASEVHPNPTTFETVTGFVWESILAAGCNARETTGLSISINMRPQTTPPIPRNLMGNCVTDVLGNATGQETFPELVGDIHSVKNRMKVIFALMNYMNTIDGYIYN
ncbi:vinorine synthase-like [Silene latifolia]|uniref:vinorine synthase-like n=1 Tax=Silene latifolia TaxID=37657 RepID=UPI003D784A79